MQRFYSSRLTSLLLRLGLAFAFLYASIASLISPQDWLGYFPLFMRDLLPSTVLLATFSGIELFVAIWLVTGWYVRYAALLSAFMLAGIIVANLDLFSIVFRDVSIVVMALALFVLESSDHPSAK